MPKSILIVTHCWAEQLPHYAAFLRYQLESLAHCPSSPEVAVCFSVRDKLTCDVMQEFASRLTIHSYALASDELGRRSIGRNLAAHDCQTSLVWFTDVDYLFGRGCLTTLASLQWSDQWSMVYPRSILINRTHAIGDRYAMRRCKIDPDDFETKVYSRAIGGVQIVQGDIARRYGYLDGKNRWQQPVEKPFGDFKDDLAFRGRMAELGEIEPILLPNLYRLRHSTTTYQ